jgi:phosphoglycerate dehydrogenase-like enzyme
MQKIVFGGPFAAAFAPLVRPHLEDCETVVEPDDSRVPAALGDADVLVTLAFTPAMGAAAGTRLKLVQLPAAGLDRIDLGAVPKGVMLANAYGHEAGIAEYIMGAMLALTRRFLPLDHDLRQGLWPGPWMAGRPRVLSPELAGKTLGILGYGRIGQALARRARAFDMTVCAIRRDLSHSPGEGVAMLGGLDCTDDLLQRSDYVAITLALNDATRGLIGARELGLMKPTAWLVNVARAEIIDGDALYRALAERRLAGAALDVWYRYPQGQSPTWPAEQKFHELPNVLMTPHVAGGTEGTVVARVAVVADNIARLARGEQPVNLVKGPE